MDNSRSIQGILVLIVGLFLAVWLGLSIVTNQMETIIQVAGVSVLIVCLALGRRIWLLIPFMGAVELSIRIPGQPTTLLLAQILVLTFSTLLILMRKLPFRLHMTELEVWLGILTLVVLQAYLRNPVGLNILGGGSVGGRPYVIFGISIMVAIILCGMKVPLGDLRILLRLSILGGLVNFAVLILGAFVPLIGYWTGGSYANAGEANYENAGTVVDTSQATRINFLPTTTRNVALWVSSFISPLRACFHPLWAPLIVFTILGAAFSGYRSSVITVGSIYLVGIAYRGGIPSLLISGLGAVMAVVLLAVVNLIHPLPPNVQRALSIIPGTWEARYVDDATGSTDWRLEIWEEALLTDRWIKNKWIGDGLGFTAQELAFQMNAGKDNRIGASGFDAHRETIMSSGDYHSTLVSGVRTCGYFGTFSLILGTWRLAIHAHRLIRRHRNDEYYSLCLFLGIPLVAAPFWLMIGSGNFGAVASTYILGIAMVRLLQNNLPLTENPQIEADLVPAPYRNIHGRTRRFNTATEAG